MSFTGLNDDCVFIILEYLDLDDLTNVAHINGKYFKLAENVYCRKYSHKRIMIEDSFGIPQEIYKMMNVNGVKIDAYTIERINRVTFDLPHQKTSADANVYLFKLPDYATIWNTFKHFGREIKKISISTTSFESSWKAEIIGYLISEYSSESLVDVAFSHDSPDKLLKHITKPLINVIDVTFKQEFSKIKTPIDRFDELFPAVRRLYLDALTDEDLVNFDCHMPHLEHLFMRRSSDNSLFPNVIAKNPQIRSIHLWSGADFKTVQKMNTLLPQLELLDILGLNLQNGSIKFDNVTTFRFGYFYDSSLVNLRFPRLKNLCASVASKRFEELLVFLNNHKHLSHLHLTVYELDDLQFKQLTANLKDLVKVTLEYEFNAFGIQKFRTNAVVEFLRRQANVWQLKVTYFPKSWITDLQEQLKHEWNIRSIDNGVSFER